VRRPFDAHLDDATLRVVALDTAGATPAAAAHLATCPRCRDRAALAARALDAHRRDAAAAADALFTAADLERQRRTIQARISRAPRPARVLPFPSHDAAAPVVRADRRWLAAAAAAGLILGAAAGQLPHWRSGARPDAPASARVAVSPPSMAAVPDPRPLEDTLLSEVEAALDTDARQALRALDALTPVHYEIR
jgi:hypothetical protein